jgi:hypothetical protein
MITAGYRGAQYNPLSTTESGVGVVVFGFVGFGFCVSGFFLLCMRVWER